MNQQEERPVKKRRGFTGLLVISNLILCIALAGAIGCHMIAEKKQTREAIAAAAAAEQELAHVEAELYELEETTIPIETFQGYAQQFGVSAEFVQQFFPNNIIYKDETGIVYGEIDENLPKNDYDWKFLSRKGKRFSYIPDEGHSALLGVDVSKHQGEIDWKKVKADGIHFAMLRGAYRGYGESGNLITDELFERNLEGALAAGLDVGVYVFSQAITPAEAVEEAKLVIGQLKDHSIAYPIVFDMEEIAGEEARTYGMSPEDVTDIAIAFCSTVEAAGYRPMIYGNPKWLTVKMQPERLTKYDTWLAQYYRTPAYPYEFSMWQYTSIGKVDGIQGNVDLNLCFKQYPARP